MTVATVCACETPAPSTWLAKGCCNRCHGRIVEPVTTRARDINAERKLSALAASAVGLTRPGPDGRSIGDSCGIDDYADHRAWPGGVRLDLDPDVEAAEELADCRSYLLWGLVPLAERFEAGDPDAAELYARRLRALSYVIKAWHALHYEGP